MQCGMDQGVFGSCGWLLIDPTCLLCGTCTDTIWHRLWECDHPDAVDIREQVCKGLLVRARTAGLESLLYFGG